MNLLSLIIIFLAIAICVSVAYIAWELTAIEPSQPLDEEATPPPSAETAVPPQDETEPPQA